MTMRYIVSVISVVSFVIFEVQGFNILGLFLHPGYSHQLVFNPVLLELARRGHNVSSVQHFEIKNAPRNFKFLKMNSPPNVGGSLSLHDYDYSFPFDRVYDFVQVYLNYNVKYAIEMCELFLTSTIAHTLYFGEEKFDLILTESFSSDCVYALAEKLDIPVIAMQSHGINSIISPRFGLPDNPAYVPEYLSWFSDNMSLLERLENALIRYTQIFYHYYVVQKAEEELIYKKLGVRIDSLEEVAKRRTKLLLTNTYHTLHRPRPLVPAIIEIGGVHIKDDVASITKELEMYINESEHGVIIFTLGTLINTSTITTERLTILQKAFSELPQNIIMKYDEDYMPNKPKNVKIMKWLPQQPLLKHKNVRAFITHGGLGGLTEAVDAGVPVLVLSVLGDQHFNGAATQESGHGITIGYRHITLDNMREALRKVLSPEMLVSVKRGNKMWKDRPQTPLDTAMFWIEFVGRNPYADLSTKAKDLPLYSLALLDIGLIALFSVLILLYSSYVTIKLVIKLIFLRKNSSKNGKKLKQQ